MSASEPKFVRVRNSQKAPMPGALEIGNTNPAELITVTVRVRRRTSHPEVAKMVHEVASHSLSERKTMGRDEYGRTHGADLADLQKVEDFANRNGLTVLDSSAPRRSVQLLGTAEALATAFNTELKTYKRADLIYRGHTDHIHVPADLAEIVESVVGFDNRPHARPHYRVAKAEPNAPAPQVTQPGFTPVQLAQIYNFPPDADGTGQVIGIIEMASPDGSGFRLSELQTYFTSLKVKTPHITTVSVAHGQNRPGTNPLDPKNADGEVMLDIEVAGAVAPGAKMVVYFAPNTAQGFLRAINQAVHDNVNKPTVISLSWGGAEDPTDQTTEQINQILQDAAAMGVTFCVAAGDSGSRDNPNDPDHAAVDFPASSPFALACGGTRLEVTGTAITDEVVWHHPTDGSGSGGGVSRVFDLPDYQKNANVPSAVNPAGKVGRGLPDICADADPDTGYQILVDGKHLTFGGTSAVAPLWAGLVARLNQKLGKPVGFLNPLLYANPGALHDITSGTNPDYTAGPGWDACSGLGSPNGVKLLQALQAPAPHAAVASEPPTAAASGS